MEKFERKPTLWDRISERYTILRLTTNFRYLAWAQYLFHFFFVHTVDCIQCGLHYRPLPHYLSPTTALRFENMRVSSIVAELFFLGLEFIILWIMTMSCQNSRSTCRKTSTSSLKIKTRPSLERFVFSQEPALLDEHDFRCVIHMIQWIRWRHSGLSIQCSQKSCRYFTWSNLTLKFILIQIRMHSRSPDKEIRVR